jgi:translation initiation factor 4G
MLTERIMHECIKKALQNVENPLEADLEAVYILLHSAGSLLDSPKARPHMDVYFSRLRELTLDGKIPNRIRFMFQVKVHIYLCSRHLISRQGSL